MSSPKGYPTSKKSISLIPGYSPEQTNSQSQFTTIQDAGSDHVGMDIVQRAPYMVSNTNAIATAFKRFITCTGLNAKKGDIIRFTSGACNGLDFPILSAPNANTAIIASEFDTTPSALDTFDLFRFTFIQVAADGSQLVSVSSGPMTIIRDGVETQVTLDTVAPYACTPIPVALTDINGSTVVNVTASGLNVKIAHNGTDPSSIRLGDGTTEVGVTAANELQVSDADALIALTDVAAELQIQNAALTTGDVANYTFNNTTGQTLYTGLAKKVRIVQNGGEMLDIYKNAAKVGSLEAGGKIDFVLDMIVTDALIVKSKAGTVTTNICWNIFN